MVIPNFDEKIKAEEARKAEIFSKKAVIWNPPESWAVTDLTLADVMPHQISGSHSNNSSQSAELTDDSINPLKLMIASDKTVSSVKKFTFL